MNRYIKVAVGSIAVAVFAMAGGSFADPSTPPTGAIRFPAQFPRVIYVGSQVVYDPASTTTATSAAVTTSTTSPSASTASTTMNPTTSSTVKPTTAPSSTLEATTAPSTMPNMGNMPMVHSIPAPTTRSWTQPYVTDQAYPYQVSDGTGAFRVTTHYSNFSYADPIAFPGGTSPHLHVFFGNTCVTATMTDPMSCNAITTDGGTLNKTAYWMPAIIDANSAAVPAGDMQVYYKTAYGGVRPQDVKAFPAGLKILAGSADTANPNNASHDYERIVNFQCNNNAGTSFNHIPTNAEGNAGGCAPGTWLVMSVQFPQCWDGVHLDSADHRMHMAYPQNGAGCPADHPVALPEITERAIYVVPAGGVPNGWRLSSDNYSYNGSNAGYSGHADWWNGWDPATMQQVVTGCENVPRDCSMDLLGNGQMLGSGP